MSVRACNIVIDPSTSRSRVRGSRWTNVVASQSFAAAVPGATRSTAATSSRTH
jgi:hypothetical protein